MARSAIVPQSGKPDSFFDACFAHPLQNSESSIGAPKHWVYSPWFCFSPRQQSSLTTPSNGNGTLGSALATAFNTTFFSPFDFGAFTATLDDSTSAIASSTEKPYFTLHDVAKSKAYACIAFSIAFMWLKLDIDIITSLLTLIIAFSFLYAGLIAFIFIFQILFNFFLFSLIYYIH
jgi:hypothetical protein